MRLVTWNIRAGGGKRISQISEVLLEENADVVVLTEYRLEAGDRIRERIASLGYQAEMQLSLPAMNGVCVLSRCPLEVHHSPQLPTSRHRWCSVSMPRLDLLLLAVHVPNQGEIWNKAEYWNSINTFADEAKNRRCIVAGDLNTALDIDCEGQKIRAAVHLERLLENGWVDVWRHCNPTAKEFTWFSHRNNGFRLDHCLVSSALSGSIRAAGLRHDVRERRVSDHSLLWVELSP